MPEPESRQLRQPRVTTLDLYRLLDAYVQASDDMVARPWRLAAGSFRRVKRQIERGLLGPWSAGRVASGIAREYADLMLGLLGTLPVTIEGIATRLSHPSPAILSEYRVPISGSEPEDVGTMFETGAASDVPFVLPARIKDASQGWAAWFVPSGKVTELIRNEIGGGRIEDAILTDFEPLDCGHGRSAVILIGADYRVSDLGHYREIALAVVLTPRGDAAKPGLYFARIVVSAQFPVDPAQQAWGINQHFFPGLNVDYGKHNAQFYAGEGTDGEFLLILPRFGNGRSFEVPIVVYSMLQADSVRAVPYAVRSVMERSGIGEGVQIGGGFELQLGQKPAADGKTQKCFCSGTEIPCLCDELRRLGINETTPAANGWTERMFASLGAPGPFHVQPFGNH